MDYLEGVVERITYHNPENGYTVLRFQVEKFSNPVTAVGSVLGVNVGEYLRLQGTWANHPKFGKQFQIERYQTLMPATLVGLEKYLGSGLIKGVGPITAKRLVRHFGLETLRVIEEDPGRLVEVPKIGRKKASLIARRWQEQKEIQNVMIFLQGHGVSPTYAVKIYRAYGDRSIETVQENPYRMAQEIWGIGFKTADKIAQQLGFQADDPFRLQSGVLYALNALSEDGHVYVPWGELVDRGAEILGVSAEVIPQALLTLKDRKEVICEDHNDLTAVYLTPFYYAELGVANRLRSLLQNPVTANASLLERIVERIEGQNNLRLSGQQRQAILDAAIARVFVLTGGPGTGKAQPNDTPVLTPDGYKPIGEVKIGDWVIGRSGQATRVIGVFPQGVKPVYRITFSDRTSTECCKDHLWTVYGKRSRHGTRNLRVLNTEQILKNLSRGDRARRMYIPLVKPVQFRKRQLLLDPYLMGVLLGDGGLTETGVRLSCGDQELVNTIAATLPAGIFCDKVPGDNVDYYLTTRSFGKGMSRDNRNPLTAALRHYGLKGCGSRYKFIPEDYLMSDVEDRLALFQGLMDTDGEVDRNGTTLGFSSCSEALALGVQWLSQSLGCVATLARKRGRYKGAIHYSYRVTIASPNGLEIFHMKSKRERKKERLKYPPKRAIRWVEFSREAACTCIQLEANDQLYCTNDFILTHNTTSVRTLVALFEQLGRRVLLASPTGRAAKRLSEVTERPARTLHRLLEFNPMQQAGDPSFKRNQDNPLEADAVIVDEVSMVDLLLMNHLLKAIPPGAQLILVGDSDQLPSVGAGDVLHDLLASNQIPTARLTEVFRQAQRSLIVMNAHRVRCDEFPILITPDGRTVSDCYFIPADTPEAILEEVQRLVTETFPRARFAPDDLQVLTPMNRGAVGANNLNTILQDLLNPARPDQAGYQRGARHFRVGDRVIQLKNDYHRNVFNGDVGKIVAIDREEQTLAVAYPDQEEPVIYDFTDTDELALANALTIHKSQGSEYPGVIVILSTQHYMMLQKNLLYTAMTRARRRLVLVGSRKAIAIALKNRALKPRYSSLARRLVQAMAGDRPLIAPAALAAEGAGEYRHDDV